jgi:general L-amino acid transport system permease protein
VIHRDWSWRSRARSRTFRGWIYQFLAVLLLVLLAWFLAANTADNMRERGMRSGFDFLSQPAGFEIGESVFAFDSARTYAQAFVVGIVNTVRVAVVGIVLATLLGAAIGVGRLSRNFLVRKICEVYVEAFRNVPVLLQLLMWYFVLTDLLPPATAALQPLPGVFLSQSGLQFPLPVGGAGYDYAGSGLFAGIVLAWLLRRMTIRRREQSGQAVAVFWPALGLIVGLPIVGWLAGGAPTALDVPEAGTFNISGGGALTPEYLTMVIGLTLYTAAFIAEIVRGGILAVPSGQTEAGAALGLARAQRLRLVLLPQALRIIVPPTTSQYLNLTKNSSLAVAVGYPDLVSIANTTSNQTGRSIECIVIIMAVYLTLSLLTALAMNGYNRAIGIRDR